MYFYSSAVIKLKTALLLKLKTDFNPAQMMSIFIKRRQPQLR